MLPIAGKTAEPNGLKKIVDTKWWPGGVIGKKKIEFFSSKYYFFSHGQRRALQLVL